jgi:hypothetical protein
MLACGGAAVGIEWQTAVDSVSLLHRRAQQRRDELFAIQEEVTLANKKLQSLNRSWMRPGRRPKMSVTCVPAL